MYSKFRHPIYYSGFLMDIGAIIYTLNWIIFAVAFTIFIIQLIRIHKEENILIKEFGKKYLDYKKKNLVLIIL
jgi:protein-S-isoprenylcysteine O-methyltransferase Ste14